MNTSNISNFVKHPDRFFIGGEWLAPSSDGTLDVVNCATEELVMKVAEAKEADIDKAVASARDAFDHGPWPRMSPRERADYLRAFKREFDNRREDLARIWSVESGVLFSTALQTMSVLVDYYETYAGLADTFPFETEYPTSPGGAKVGLLVREPVGVVGAIIPWNGPTILFTHKCAPALIAGCTIVLKASPETPLAGYVIGEICEKIGLPPGVLNVVTANRPASESLVRHPGVDKITFTGSTAAGRRVASICGERLARCTLELGGKSPGIILDDYDIEKAAATISAKARFLSGQVCSSLTRIIVSQHRHDALVEALSASFGKTYVGDPFDPRTEMGPLAMQRQRERVEGYIAKGQAEGAILAAGGGRPAALARGYYVEPTVFGNVSNSSTIAREEIFGPVLSVIPVKDERDAVKTANDTIYGLAAAVFSDDADRVYEIGRQLRAGSIGQNTQRTEFLISCGGYKQSGMGREGVIEGIHEFQELKTLLLDSYPGHTSAQQPAVLNENRRAG